MSIQKQFRCFALLALCLGCAQLLFAQGTDLGTIRGLVTDSSGAVIPNAKVTILDLGTNTTRETATNARGEYQMFGLRSGNYKVSVSASGLTTQDITGVVLNGSDVVSANATLRLASLRGISYYDATYIALAEMLDCPLITADGRLARRAQATGHVRLLSKD